MITIRTFKKSDITDVAKLVHETFLKYNQVDGTKDAVAKYLHQFETDPNLEQLAVWYSIPPKVLLAVDNGEIVGVLWGKWNRVINLFVKETHHNQGIATKLYTRFEATLRKHGSTEIKVRSSSYAVPFYEKMGFKKTTGRRNFHGFSVQPMKKLLK